MLRLLLVMPIVGGCGNSKPEGEQPPSGSAKEPSIAVPNEQSEGRTRGGDGSSHSVGSAPGAPDLCTLTPATKQRAQDPTLQLKPEEGTLAIARMESRTKMPATAEI